MESKLLSHNGMKPIVTIASDTIERYGHQAYSVFFGYVEAISYAAEAVPFILPSDPKAIDYPSVLAQIDGILLTGSPSNVSPKFYGKTLDEKVLHQDLNRDETILPLIKLAIEMEVPILGICRGFQEINVAFGGTLNPSVSTLPGAIDHREGDHSRPIQEWYADSHSIEILPDGILASLHSSNHAIINSLHHQGIEKLGDGLRIEAKAPDGLIEAFSIQNARGFTLAVQWHPEMRFQDDALSNAIFKRFGDACRQRQQKRLGQK